MNPFWGVYWAIALAAAVWQWRRSRSSYQGGIDRALEAFAFGLLWWLCLLGLAAFHFCEWFDKKFAGRGQ